MIFRWFMNCAKVTQRESGRALIQVNPVTFSTSLDYDLRDQISLAGSRVLSALVSCWVEKEDPG